MTTTATSNTKPKLKLIVLQSAGIGCEYEGDDCPANVTCHLRRNGITEEEVEVEDVLLYPETYAQTLVELVQKYKSSGKDDFCFMNLCDGAWDEPSVGENVIDLLEHKLNVPYTGANRECYEPTRLQMKQVALAYNVLVPAWRFIYSKDDLAQLMEEFQRAADEPTRYQQPLNFPLLPKHFSSYSSVGLIKESKVHTVQDLQIQCTRMIERYGGCLIEEFIEGREFTILVSQQPKSTNNEEIETFAYEPIECKFGAGEDFKHYNLKWIDYDGGITWHKVQDPDLSQRLKKLATDIFVGTNSRGYGRLDIRSDPSGKDLYFLEINPNCGILYPEGMYGSADFILDLVNPVSAHSDFILNQVDVARRIYRNKNFTFNKLEPRYKYNHTIDAVAEEAKEKDNRRTKKEGSWGLYALRDIQQGETIQYNEESAFHLVTKQKVIRSWANVPIQYQKNMATNKDTTSLPVIMNDNTSCASTTNSETTTTDIKSWDNFAAYCWPVSDNLFVMWDPNPDKWRPINHSCDPNAWNEDGNGLNVVARRSIKKDEEVTMDYATFVGYFPEMKSFPCSCNAACCRKIISGMDIIKYPELATVYHGHMTDYIASKVVQNQKEIKQMGSTATSSTCSSISTVIENLSSSSSSTSLSS